MCSFLSNQQLQKKNELYLQVSSLEESTRPLREDYQTLSKKFNESLTSISEEYTLTLQKIQKFEEEKIRDLKKLASSYLKINKSNTDTVLETYPFLMEEIDRVRERQDLFPLNRQSLQTEIKQLDCLTVHQSNYIDTIYERIEVKKNL